MSRFIIDTGLDRSIAAGIGLRQRTDSLRMQQEDADADRRLREQQLAQQDAQFLDKLSQDQAEFDFRRSEAQEGADAMRRVGESDVSLAVKYGLFPSPEEAQSSGFATASPEMRRQLVVNQQRQQTEAAVARLRDEAQLNRVRKVWTGLSKKTGMNPAAVAAIMRREVDELSDEARSAFIAEVTGAQVGAAGVPGIDPAVAGPPSVDPASIDPNGMAGMPAEAMVPEDEYRWSEQQRGMMERERMGNEQRQAEAQARAGGEAAKRQRILDNTAIIDDAKATRQAKVAAVANLRADGVPAELPDVNFSGETREKDPTEGPEYKRLDKQLKRELANVRAFADVYTDAGAAALKKAQAEVERINARMAEIESGDAGAAAPSQGDFSPEEQAAIDSFIRDTGREPGAADEAEILRRMGQRQPQPR